jgi:putative aldouronate transport system permease protein
VGTNTVFLVFLCAVTLYPLLYILFSSLSEPESLLMYTGVLYKPLGFSLESYRRAFSYPLLFSGYMNTLFVLAVGLAVNLTLTAFGAFFLTRGNVMWQRPIALVIVFTMFFNGGLIPFYFTVKDLGLYNSIWSLIFPTAINTFNLIIMRTGFAAVPRSLEESAEIDGASHLTMMFKIIMPLSLPTVSIMILYYGVAHWNAWFNASIFLRDSYKWPLQLVARQVLLQNDTSRMAAGAVQGSELAISETIKYSVIVISTLPILVIYPFLQRYFVKGVMVGAIKA